jgi:hypothetical protein
MAARYEGRPIKGLKNGKMAARNKLVLTVSWDAGLS